MASLPSTSQTAYHEYEPRDPSEKFLLCSKKKDSFKVRCSKALLNCLLQRQQFKENIVLRLDPEQLETVFLKLRLQEFFKLNEIEKWFSRNEANSIGSILAASETLSNFNVFLCPIDHTTYTVLVERPTGFFCLIDNSWVVIREIRGRWFQLDPRMTGATQLSESYLCMIIKQLLVDNLPVFRISGEGFSRSNTSRLPQNVISNPLGQYKSILENVTFPPVPVLSDSNLVDGGLLSKPVPQPPNHQSSRENVCRLQNALKGLDISSETTKKTKIKTKIRGFRTRSETRTQILANTGYLQISSENQASFDWEWPPLPPLRTTSRRTRSSPRTQKLQLQQYYPPRDVGENSEKREIERKSRRDDPKPLVRKSACCICLESSPDHALVPCGHKCLCLKCKSEYLKKFNTCPICSKGITDAIKIYNT